MNLLKKLKRGISHYGYWGTFTRSPMFLYSRIKKLRNYPSTFSRFGISKKRWERFQIHHELDFWTNLKNQSTDNFKSIKEKFLNTNKNRFLDLKLNFPNGTIVDIGCGPLGGILPYTNAKNKIGIDPLADKYKELYNDHGDIKLIASMAEDIPLQSASVDACYCINVLDHTSKPYKAMTEIMRILKPGGYLAFCVDIGGTKEHPVKIYEKDLNNFFAKYNFKIIEKSCSTEKSTWGKDANIPLYVFQGYKL